MVRTIFVTRKIPPVGIALLEAKGYTVDVNPNDETLTHDELIVHLKEKAYDAVLTLLTDHIDTSVFDAAPTVMLYANYATGYDNFDLVSAQARGITMTNAPSDLASDSVAEHTLALIYALATRIVEADAFVRAGKYTGWVPMNFIGTDLSGKTLGLIGCGRIGSKVAHLAKALGLSIIYTDIARNEALEKELDATYMPSPEDLLPHADVVSLHTPLMDSTRHLINEDRLTLMKPTSFLINTSRGQIVDEQALVNALEKGIIRGAGLDVFEFEPKISVGLLQSSKVILTPHIGSASQQARDEMAEIAAQNIIDFFEGITPRNVLNHK
jgi:glyoxylate reductase